MSVLRVANVSKHFGGLKAVDDVTFDVNARTITSLIGPNGAGKTTIFNVVSGLLPRTGGEVFYRGFRISGLAPHKIARLGLGRTFQEPRLFNRMRVLDNVMVGFPDQTGENPLVALMRTGKWRRQEEGNYNRAMEILKFVELEERAFEIAENLSFGQQRFLSVARVLAADPEVLLMDEPTVGLHPLEVKKLIELMVEMVKARERTILLIEHNMDVVMSISDWIFLLVEGRIVASEAPGEMKEHPKLTEAYLGTSYSSRAAASGGAPRDSRA